MRPFDTRLSANEEDTLPSSHRSSRPRVRTRWMLPIAAFVTIAILSSPSGALAQDGAEAVYDYDFGSDAEGWTVGFADLPVGLRPVDLRARPRTSPPSRRSGGQWRLRPGTQPQRRSLHVPEEAGWRAEAEHEYMRSPYPWTWRPTCRQLRSASAARPARACS